jgi:hypothetical protein
MVTPLRRATASTAGCRWSYRIPSMRRAPPSGRASCSSGRGSAWTGTTAARTSVVSCERGPSRHEPPCSEHGQRALDHVRELQSVRARPGETRGNSIVSGIPALRIIQVLRKLCGGSADSLARVSYLHPCTLRSGDLLGREHQRAARAHVGGTEPVDAHGHTWGFRCDRRHCRRSPRLCDPGASDLMCWGSDERVLGDLRVAPTSVLPSVTWWAHDATVPFPLHGR